MATLEYFFDFVSPYSYIAQTQLRGLVERTGATLAYRPILLGALHKSHEIASPAFVPAKAKWIAKDCALWAHHYNIPMQWSKSFPFNSLFLQRAVAWLQQQQPEKLDTFVDATFKALWEQGLNPTDVEAVAAHCANLGLDPQAMVSGTELPEVKEVVKLNTATAKELGLFGAPGFKVGEHVLFGQDRMHFVEAALNGTLPKV